MRKVLFLCTANACRSQIAEAIVNAGCPGWRASSAGTHPAAMVHPMTRQVLLEIGIEHRGEPKSSDQFRGESFDLVVTVCDDAKEECPTWLGKGKRLHESITDPANAEGSETERLAVFREVRDQISGRIPALLE